MKGGLLTPGMSAFNSLQVEITVSSLFKIYIVVLQVCFLSTYQLNHLHLPVFKGSRNLHRIVYVIFTND